MNLITRTATGASAALLAASLSAPASACSSCGCTLNADWASQGLHTGTGWTLELRHDHFSQTELRSGTGRVDRAAIALPADQEIQQQTINRNSTLTLDYGFNADWGLTLQLPYFVRDHATFAPGDTEPSTSRSSSVGDARLLGRYQGLSAEHDWGLQFGLKLPSGRTDVSFRAGPQADTPLDRGLQPGTGTTDLLLGAYAFGAAGDELGYFVQALLQLPMNSKDGFRPGAGINLGAGLRYLGAGRLVPHLQLNVRSERRESGVNADAANSGATLIYLSPGATLALTDRLQAYGFVQRPIFQRVNGLQLEPRLSVSVGLRAAF